jgi:hypothetical protein
LFSWSFIPGFSFFGIFCPRPLRALSIVSLGIYVNSQVYSSYYSKLWGWDTLVKNPLSKGGNIEGTKVKERNNQGHIDQGLIVSLRIYVFLRKHTNYKIHDSSVLGYNDFDFFLTKWSLPGRWWMPNWILRHIYKIRFFVCFFEPFRPRLIIQLAKSANAGPKF